MKVVRVKEAGVLVIDEEQEPVIEKEDEVIIQVISAGICGSDISIYQGTSPVAIYPRVIGHEFAGNVISAGESVTDLKRGDHVVVNPVCSCGTCRVCQKGRGNVCANLNVLGVHLDGGYQEYVKVRRKNVFKISDQIPWEHAAIVEPYTVAAQVAIRGGIEKDDMVLICGSGQIALTILQICNIIGAKCIMTDVIEERLKQALDFGALHVIRSDQEDVAAIVKSLTGGIGVDVAIDAACVGITLKEAALSVRPAGVVVTMGFKEKDVQISEFLITSKELDIRGTRLNNHCFPQVIQWFEEKKIDPSKIITDRFQFTDITSAFDKIAEDPENTMKIILTFGGEKAL